MLACIKGCIKLGPKLPFQPHLLLLPYKCSFLHPHWSSSPLCTCWHQFPTPECPPPTVSLPYQLFSLLVSCENPLVFEDPMEVPEEQPQLRTTHVLGVCAAQGASGWRDLRCRQLLLRTICNSDKMILISRPALPPTSSLSVLLDTSLLWNSVSPQFLHTSFDTSYIRPWFHKLFFMSVLLFIYSDLQKAEHLQKYNASQTVESFS